jgi:hypothetical protein
MSFMKVKYVLEYPMNCSPLVLYPRLSTAGGLSEWFAENVDINGKYFIFYWDDTGEKAEALQKRENYFIRFHWVEDVQEQTYFEFRIITDELTGDIALVVTDFAENDEKEDAIEVWNSQVSGLKHCVGV